MIEVRRMKLLHLREIPIQKEVLPASVAQTAECGTYYQKITGESIVGMAKHVSSYSIIYDGSNDYRSSHLQIQLYDVAGEPLAWICFSDPEGLPEADADDGGVIRMNLPSAMFYNVLEILQNEQSINVYFSQGQGCLEISDGPVGKTG